MKIMLKINALQGKTVPRQLRRAMGKKPAAYEDLNAYIRCGKTPNKQTNGYKLSIFISFVYYLQYSTIPNLTLKALRVISIKFLLVISMLCKTEWS